MSTITREEQFNYLWKYFELHVHHRQTMMNYLLVTTALFAVFAKDVLSSEFAPYVFALGSSFAFSFFMLDTITQQKICAVKDQITLLLDENSPHLFDLMRGENSEGGGGMRGLRFVLRLDPFWAAVLEGGLSAGLSAAAVRSAAPASSPMWAFAAATVICLLVATVFIRITIPAIRPITQSPSRTQPEMKAE